MASELDIINDEDFEAPLKLGANYKKLANEFDGVVASTGKLVHMFEDEATSISKLNGSAKQLEKETHKLEAANKKAAKSAESMATATTLADNATGGLISKTKELGKQFFALVKNPLIAMFVALGVVLSSVAVYFKSTNEGADKLEKILAAVGAVGDFLTNKIAALGEQVFKLFEEGNVVGEAFLWVFNQILNRVSGVIDTFTNLLKVINVISQYNLKDLLLGNLKPEDVKALDKAFSDLGKSAVQVLTGVGDAAEEVAKQVESVTNLTEAAQKLGDELRDRILSSAQAELEIEKLLFDAKDKTNNTDKQRLAALQKAVKLSEDQLKIDLDHAVRKERLFTADLLRSKQIITNNAEANAILKQGTSILQDQILEQKASDEQLEERKKLQADVVNLQRAFFAENKKSISQIGALQKEIDDEAIKRAEIMVKARVKALNDYLISTKEVNSREILGVQSVIEEEKGLRKSFHDRLIEDSKARLEHDKEVEKQRTEMLKEQEEKRQLIRTTAIQAVGMIGDEIFARRNTKLDEEAKKIEDLRAKDLAAAGDDERKKLAINRKADREVAKIKTKQAQNDKAAAIFGIIINTALGIVKAAPVVPLMIATGIIGALQLALVASKPIPKFGGGTDFTPDTFIAGEKGREIVSRHGKSIVADRATLFTGMMGSRVFANPATEEILGTANDIGPAISYGSRIRRDYSVSSRALELQVDSNRWLKRIANKPEIDFVVDEEGFHRYSSKVSRRNARIDRRFRGL